MRPRTLEQFIGQEHILGEGKLLRRMLQADAITGLILHGPPGTGKTTLAEVIANATNRHFERENAASVGVRQIRDLIEGATHRLAERQQRTILFLDEIHRFTKAQQDVLLPDTERGVITLIGATTENPLFACNAALISRSTLFRLEPLRIEHVVEVLRRAIADPDRGYGRLDLHVDDDALRLWAVKCEGDARRALTALEVAVLSQRIDRGTPDTAPGPVRVDRHTAEDSIQRKAVVYSVTGDQHYDMISAMIKSIRGSDPDAAIYWIASMLEGGEDPRFIARRLAILASEDIGNADPRAIMVADAGWSLVERIGMPEARITLAQIATYLALAPKSNASYVAIDEATADVQEGRTVPIPMFLRDPNTSPDAVTRPGQASAKRQRSYEYSQDADDAVTGQDYLGVPKSYYRPTDRGHEKQLAERLEQIRALREQLRREKKASE
ncbi:MAG: replication-associated recombination protein A [Phycisphaeraceae bacterium]|nr:replication-associated recombination protein A [Phycisphaeraceae bacterium]